MKKGLMVISSAALALFLTACNGQDANTNPEQNEPKVATEQQVEDVDAQVKKAIDEAKLWSIERVDGIVTNADEFEKAVQAGDYEKAKELWLPMQLEYEKGEALFASLSAELDESMDVSTETGFHGIEQILWGKEDPATQQAKLLELVTLLKEDAAKLKTIVNDAQLNEQLLFEAMTGILPELAGFVESVYTGESISGTRIEDARKVFEGVQLYYDAVSLKVVEKAPETDKIVRAQMEQVLNVMKQEKPDVAIVDQEFGALFTLLAEEAAPAIGVDLKQ